MIMINGIEIINGIVSINTGNKFYQTFINAKLRDQKIELFNTIEKTKEEYYTVEYELNDHVLLILRK